VSAIVLVLGGVSGRSEGRWSSIRRSRCRSGNSGWLPARGVRETWQVRSGLALDHFQASSRDASELRAQLCSENFKHSSMRVMSGR
jgi:hypothetical protein